jgi:hypothetical protein
MTKHARLRLIILFLSAFALTAAYQHTKTETAMVETAKNFLASLTPEQRAQAVSEFGAENRTHWHFVPDANYEKHYGHQRRGLLYKKMSSQQQRLADALLSAGLSKSGFIKASTIMSLEEILRVLEKDIPAGRRDPERYASAARLLRPSARWNRAFRS